MSIQGLLIMGVSGSGKTSLGRILARELGWEFIDADDFHSPENIAMMKAGIPLEDAERLPWLESLHDRLRAMLQAGAHPILACSALKDQYRVRLLRGLHGIAIIHLEGSYALIRARIAGRKDHFMQPGLLESQFEALETPTDALVLEVARPLRELVETVIQHLEKDR